MNTLVLWQEIYEDISYAAGNKRVTVANCDSCNYDVDISDNYVH
jgi:hypothetical protein